MSYENIKKAKVMARRNKETWLNLYPNLNDSSGIYILVRVDENNFKYAYVGQAKHILTRLAQHLSGYQHIDLSLKKHGLCKNGNEYGWFIRKIIECPESMLDEKEQQYIKEMADLGYQLRNKTAGGQGTGKSQINEYKPSKGYRDGLQQGYKNASREVAGLFDKHLVFATKSDKPNSYQKKAVKKFLDFLKAYKSEGDA